MDEITKYIWQKNDSYGFSSFESNIYYQGREISLRKNGKIKITSKNLEKCLKQSLIQCNIDGRNFKLKLISENNDDNQSKAKLYAEFAKNSDVIYVSKFFF